MQRSALCRSRRELSNEYLLARIGVDTAENEPLEVWEKIQFTIHFTPYAEAFARLNPGLQARGGEVAAAEEATEAAAAKAADE